MKMRWMGDIMEEVDRAMIKCPNHHMGGILNKRSCFYEHPFHKRTSCKISGQYLKPPCDHGMIKKELYEKLAYPKKASWLNWS